jgi:hypothetical protein
MRNVVIPGTPNLTNGALEYDARVEFAWADLTETNEGEIWQNAVRPRQSGSVVRRFSSGMPESPNNEVEAVLKVLSFDVGPQAGVIGRAVKSGDAYEAIYDGITMRWELRHLWGAEITPLGTRPEAISPGLLPMALRMKGNLIELLVRGEPKISVRDSAVSGTGQVGIMLFQREEGKKMSGIHIDRIEAHHI